MGYVVSHILSALSAPRVVPMLPPVPVPSEVPVPRRVVQPPLPTEMLSRVVEPPLPGTRPSTGGKVFLNRPPVRHTRRDRTTGLGFRV